VCAHCSYSFLDINPLSKGHALIIPKCTVSSTLSPFEVWVLNGLLFVCLFFGGAFDVVVDHAEKLHQLPDEYLADALPIAKKIAVAQGAENYNFLQVGICFPVNPIFHPLCVWASILSGLTIGVS